MAHRIRTGARLALLSLAALMLVLTHAGPTLATSSNTVSFESGSYDFSVDENTPENTVVGTVSASDSDGDALTYSVGETDAVKFNEVFALNTGTGEVTVKLGATINYESSDQRTSYQVDIKVTDGEDDSGVAQTEPTTDATVSLRIRVNNVNDPGSATISTSWPQVGVPDPLAARA